MNLIKPIERHDAGNLCPSSKVCYSNSDVTDLEQTVNELLNALIETYTMFERIGESKEAYAVEMRQLIESKTGLKWEEVKGRRE